MLVIGTFEHSLELELLLANVENKNIPRKHIMVVPMDVDPQNPRQFDSKKRESTYKAVEVGIACATGCSIFGASVGFILAWGPIFWGVITAAMGFLLGYGGYLFFKKPSRYAQLPNEFPEVLVIVQCLEEQSKCIMDEMWKHRVLTVGKYNNVQNSNQHEC